MIHIAMGVNINITFFHRAGLISILKGRLDEGNFLGFMGFLKYYINWLHSNEEDLDIQGNRGFSSNCLFAKNVDSLMKMG
jgi:hypothetical protein